MTIVVVARLAKDRTQARSICPNSERLWWREDPAPTVAIPRRDTGLNQSSHADWTWTVGSSRSVPPGMCCTNCLRFLYCHPRKIPVLTRARKSTPLVTVPAKAVLLDFGLRKSMRMRSTDAVIYGSGHRLPWSVATDQSARRTDIASKIELCVRCAAKCNRGQLTSSPGSTIGTWKDRIMGSARIIAGIKDAA